MSKYQIGEIGFKTKTEAVNYTRNILKNNLGRIITKNDKLFNYLLCMVEMHTDRDEKIGAGIDSFIIKLNNYNNIALYINRIDNTKIDISWKYVCQFKPRNSNHNLISALRNSINYQICEYRSKNSDKLICELCQSKNNIHIDHIIHFQKIREDFINSTRLTIPEKFDDCPNTHQAVFKYKDLEFRKQWAKYHKENATLRPLCRDCNLSRPKYKHIKTI